MDVTCKWEQDRADPFTGSPYFKTQCGHTVQPSEYLKYFTFPTHCIHCKKMILEVADLFGPTDRRPSEEQMPCPNCGGTLHGDGVTMVPHCEYVDLDFGNMPEPDADPVYCEEETVQPTGTNPLPAQELLKLADDAVVGTCQKCRRRVKLSSVTHDGGHKTCSGPVRFGPAGKAYRAARSASPVTLEEADAEEAARKMVMGWRGIAPDDRVCVKCAGSGVRTYGNTTTWYGGIGGQQMTSDTCDRCWGSGAENRPWLNLKNNARRLAGEGGA